MPFNGSRPRVSPDEPRGQQFSFVTRSPVKRQSNSRTRISEEHEPERRTRGASFLRHHSVPPFVTLNLYCPLLEAFPRTAFAPRTDHAVCVSRIASLLSACPFRATYTLSRFHLFSSSLFSTILGQPRRDEARGKLKYADFYRRPRVVNGRMVEPRTENEKGLDHKGCGRPDFTGRRVLGNYRTFKVRKGSVTHYLTLDTFIVKSSTLRVVTLASYPSRGRQGAKGNFTGR